MQTKVNINKILLNMLTINNNMLKKIIYLQKTINNSLKL